MAPSYWLETSKLHESIDDGSAENPSESERLFAILDALVTSRDGLSSPNGGGRSGVLGTLGPDPFCDFMRCESTLSAAASAMLLMVGRVFLTNWLLVMRCSISARWRSVLSMRMEKAIVCTTSTSS